MTNVEGAPCAFISDKGVQGDILDRPAHYVLSGNAVPHIISFLQALKNISTKLLDSVLVFYAQEPPPLNIVEALEKGYSIAFLGAKMSLGKCAYKDLIDMALECRHIIPIPMSYTPQKVTKFYGYALHKTEQINMEDLLHG